MSRPPSVDEILDAARLAVDSYFTGEFKTKRSIRQDMSNLRSMLRDYDAKQETQRITKDRLHG
jgi:hypothetical protein